MEDMLSTSGDGTLFDAPRFYCPVPQAATGFMDRAEQHALAWLDSYGLKAPASVLKAGLHRLIGYITSGAVDEEAFRAVVCFTFWATIVDDAYFDGESEQLALAVEVAGQAMRVITTPSPEVDRTQPPYIAALQDVTGRLQALCPPQLFTRFTSELRRSFSDMLRMLAVRQRGVMPTEDQYISMRLGDCAALLSFLMIEICGRQAVPEEEASTAAFQAAMESGALIAALDNDVYSYRKELGEPGHLNLIIVIRDNRGITLQEAVAEAVAIRDRIMLFFHALHAKLMPTASPQLRMLLDQIARMPRGHIEWAQGNPRYQLGVGEHGVIPAEPWADAPSTADHSPLPYPSISWWWRLVAGRTA
jgi:hypothetical protein